MKLIVNWLLSTIALLVVAHLVPGIHVSGLTGALWAALVIGLVNATVGALLRLITLPLTVLTLGLFLLIINALMFKFSTVFAPGLSVHGFWAAFWGALIMSLVSMFLRWLVWPRKERRSGFAVHSMQPGPSAWAHKQSGPLGSSAGVAANRER